MNPATSTPTAEHVVASPVLRAHIAQREFENRYPPGHWLPYIHTAFATLPRRVMALIEAGHPRSADYWLLNAEHFTGVLPREAFTRYVTALGPFELAGE